MELIGGRRLLKTFHTDHSFVGQPLKLYRWCWATHGNYGYKHFPLIGYITEEDIKLNQHRYTLLHRKHLIPLVSSKFFEHRNPFGWITDIEMEESEYDFFIYWLIPWKSIALMDLSFMNSTEFSLSYARGLSDNKAMVFKDKVVLNLDGKERKVDYKRTKPLGFVYSSYLELMVGKPQEKTITLNSSAFGNLLFVQKSNAITTIDTKEMKKRIRSTKSIDALGEKGENDVKVQVWHFEEQIESLAKQRKPIKTKQQYQKAQRIKNDLSMKRKQKPMKHHHNHR